MPKSPKRTREQAVVYLGARDRTLLEQLAAESGLSHAELFRRGLWALAAQMHAGASASGFEHLIAGAGQSNAPADLSERADDYLYGGAYEARRVAERPPGLEAEPSAARPHGAGKRARPR